MKKTVKLMALVMVIASILLLLTGCQESNEAKYSRAQKLLSEGKYDEAIKVFDEISTYEDASKLSMYTKAIAAAEGGDYETAIKGFTALGDYKDCTMQITYYTARQYENQGSAENWSSWILAAETYDSLVLFRDSQERAKNCRKSVYDEAIQLRKMGDWDGATALFRLIEDYSDASMQIQETAYQQAKSYYDSGDYSKAYEVYQTILGYKDVDSLLSTDDHLLDVKKQTLYKTVGSIVTFGQYEQDNNMANGPEAIEWIVLEVQDGKSLLLSKYGMDEKPYNVEFKDITWEKSSIRAWLNNEFMKSAFTLEEQSAILMTTVDNSASQGYSAWDTRGGKNTQDYLFLLSYAEAKRYLGVTSIDNNNTKSRVAPTAYAKANGAYTSKNNKTSDGEAAGWWWLRSPGEQQYLAADVRDDGSLNEYSIHRGTVLVRPAFWLNLESDIF